MARIQYGPLMGVRADADLSTTGRYRFVKIISASGVSADNEPFVDLADTEGEDILGVLMDKPKEDETATVQTYDTVKVEAGAAIPTVGGKVMTDNVGRAIAATGTGKFALGTVLEAAGASGVIVSVRLNQGHYPIPA